MRGRWIRVFPALGRNGSVLYSLLIVQKYFTLMLQSASIHLFDAVGCRWSGGH